MGWIQIMNHQLQRRLRIPLVLAAAVAPAPARFPLVRETII